MTALAIATSPAVLALTCETDPFDICLWSIVACGAGLIARYRRSSKPIVMVPAIATVAVLASLALVSP